MITGLGGRSLSVLAIGLGVLADVTGSATLIWRSRRAAPVRPVTSREARAAIVVTLALATANATASGWGMPGSSAPVEVPTVDVTAGNARAPEFRFEIVYHAGWAAQEGRQPAWVLAGAS